MREGYQEPVRLRGPMWTAEGDIGAVGRGHAKRRFALGCFAEPACLAEACRSLAARGLEPHAIDRFACERGDGSIPGVTGQHVLAHEFLGTSLATDLQHWLVGRLAEQVQKTLRAGGGVLLVEVCDDKQLQQVCSTLLCHAATGVQTHDIRRFGQARAES